MSKAEIDLLTADFYKTISFERTRIPDLEDVKALFVGEGAMINNTFGDPIVFTVESFIKALENQVGAGNLSQFKQHEISSKTEIFGKVAQRLSVYEYSFADHEIPHMPRGVNFIQYAHIGGGWKITSMVWNDENESNIIPEEYLV